MTEKAAATVEETTAAPRGRWIGARVQRVEDPRFLLGEAKYVADLTLPRMVHAAFVRSPHAHAKIVAVDTTAAEALPGVLAVMTGHDLRHVPPLVDGMMMEGLSKTPQHVLAVDRVRFVGEPVAVIVAGDRYAAEDAAELISIEYEPLEAVTDAREAMRDDAPVLFDEVGSNVVYRRHESIGDVEDALRGADHVFAATFHTNRFMAAPMETRGCLAQFERASSKLTLWSSTQTPHLSRMMLAPLLAVPEQRIRVVAPDVGGGFGQKISIYPEEVVVPLLAMKLGRPVKWIEDRREHLISATHAKEQVIDLEVGVQADGILRGVRARYVGDGGGYSFNTSSVLVEPHVAAKLMPSVYKLDNYEYEVVGVVTNKTPVGPYRAIGWTAAFSAREVFFDEIARELGLDPLEFRRKNMIESDEFPYESCTGMLYDSGSYVESLDAAAEAVGYDEVRARQAELRRQGRYIGIGFSPYNEETGWGSDAAFQAEFPFPSHDNVTVTMEPSGKVVVAVGTCGHGQGHETTLAQVAADVLGIGVADVSVVFGDTDVSPYGMGTYASRTAVIGGGAVTLAAGDVREKLLRVAGRLLEADPEDLAIENGAFHVVGSPGRAVPAADVALASYFDPRGRFDDDDPYPAATRFYDPKAAFSNGCIAVVAEVDPEYGTATLERIVAVEDCGTIINPTIVEGQVHGAVAQGIGGALLEHLVYGADGQLLTTTYMDYLVPTISEVPVIDVVHLCSPSPFTVKGIKGMGEGGLLATPGAVLNAVIDALAPFEPRVRAFPMTPDRIFEIVGEAGPDAGM